MAKRMANSALKKGVCYYIVPNPGGVTAEQVDAFMLENVEACRHCTIKQHCSMEERRRASPEPREPKTTG